MRRFTAILICISFCLVSKAQLYDAQWALGYDQSVVDFRNSDSVSIYTLPTIEYFTFTNASICDESGNLLYYTNGISVCNIGGILQNGTGLNPCAYTDNYTNTGLNISQAAIFMPKPGNNRYYYLFHFSNDAPDNARPSTIYYSLIDKQGNNDSGKVIQKNVPIFQGTELRGGGMTACKHANGRDYWLVMGGSNNNRFYKFLITPAGILGPYIQDIGPVFPIGYDVAYSKFSQDGSKFATGIFIGAPLLVMDFDRCSGEFSNPDTIHEITDGFPNQDSLEGCYALEFSPNNRYLYVSNPQNLVQFDLQTMPVHDSLQLFLGDSTDFYSIHMLQDAPNGKVYASTWNGGFKALHVINHPDLKGDSADFVYGGQPTYTIASNNLPNLINYKLGALIGSGCDTLQTSIKNVNTEDRLLRILPNPANKFLYVEMGMQGNYQFELSDINGHLLAQRQTPQVDYFDTEHLPAGSYLLRVLDKATGNEIAAKQVVVVH